MNAFVTSAFQMYSAEEVAARCKPRSSDLVVIFLNAILEPVFILVVVVYLVESMVTNAARVNEVDCFDIRHPWIFQRR